MSRRPDRYYAMPGHDEYEPPFGLYQSTFQQSYPRNSGNPNHFDGVGFWYRPEPQEAMFEHNRLLYNQGMSVGNTLIDQPMSIKHRRTRSGCFTCRHRRVKCDETRPICERCKKGNRECQFPQPSSSSRRADQNESRSGQDTASPRVGKTNLSQTLTTIEDDDDEDEDEDEDSRERTTSPVAVLPQPSVDTHRNQSSKPIDSKPEPKNKTKASERRESESPMSAETTSLPSRTATPASASSTPQVQQVFSSTQVRWKHLNSAMQQYLQFHHDHITRHHYFLKLDPNDFIHNDLIDIALSFEPLLCAVVGFSAYIHTLENSGGRFQDFWKYYCQSIMLLRKWLEAHTERNEAALLTILQLAAFEEYLGDWASVASHHRAAYSIFSTLYTFDNIMATETSRCIFDWLARGDVTVSVMAGTTTVLERQWFVSALEWQQAQVYPDDFEVITTISCLIARLRLIGFDMATVHADTTSNPNAMKDIQSISKKLDSLRVDIQALHNASPALRTMTRGNKAMSITDDVLQQPPPLLQGILWPVNFLWSDWYASQQMHKYQTALYVRAIQARTQSRSQTVRNASISQNSSLPPELEKLSLIQCQIFEAIEKSPHAPAGAALGCQASLALASVFLAKTPKYITWARRKLARIERMGYVWPPTFRKRMALLWNDNSVLEWWLPTNEFKVDLLNEIREVVEERSREIESRGGDVRDDVREMKAVFDKLDFGKGGLRRRKDSVWGAAGNDRNQSIKSQQPVESDSSSEGGPNTDEEPEEEQHVTPRTRRASRDSGVGGTPNFSRRTQMQPPPLPPPPPPPPAPAPLQQQPPQTLEYSNRMSGIWEGPMH